MKELVYARLLAAAVEQNAHRTMVIDGDHAATWEQHWERITRLVGVLRYDLGVAAGDRYAVLSLNSHRYMELYHGAFLGAGIVNPLNTRLTAAELEYILDDSGTRVVFVDATFEELLAPIAARLCLRVVRLSDSPDGNQYEELLAGAAHDLPPEPEETDPVILMYTGGTTGLPKGVVHDHRGQVLNMYHLQFGFPFEDSSRALLCVPMFHAGGLSTVLIAPAVGATTIIQSGFDPAAFVAATDTHQVTHWGVVPTILAMLIRHPAFDPDRLRSVRRALCGGSPLPLALLQEIETVLPDLVVVQGYGMTEAGLFVSGLRADQRAIPERMQSVGRATLGVGVCIQQSDGSECARGEIGEICVRGGNLLREYWKQPEATADALRGGWYHTGDAGYLDDDGYIFVKDRVKDMIITGGENVYSAEVENAITNHLAVGLVAVIGIPHDVWGEVVHAIVVLKPGAEVTSDALIEHVRGQIAGYKVPKSVEFREALPLSGFMKPLKRELRRPFWEAVGEGTVPAGGEDGPCDEAATVHAVTSPAGADQAGSGSRQP